MGVISYLENDVDLSGETDAQIDFKFAKWLSKNKKLQGIPPSAFFSQAHKSIGDDYIRFCFIKVLVQNYLKIWREKSNWKFGLLQKEESLQKARDILLHWKKEMGK